MNRLKEIRKSNKLTQDYVAKYLNISQSAYAKYENYKSQLTEEYALKLCKLFKCTLNELFGVENPEVSKDDVETLKKAKEIIESITHLKRLM